MREAEALSESADRLAPLQKSAAEEQFTHIAETLDAAGLGPADYIYAPLKWRLQKPEISRFSLRRALWRAAKDTVVNPPPVPRKLPQAAILVASSYVVSANLLRQVVATLEQEERVFYYVGDIPPQPLSTRLAGQLTALSGLGPALLFAARVRSTLKRAGVAPVEHDRVALAAFLHRMYRQTARAVLGKVRPKCLVLGNGNRPLEFSLWAEAKARGVTTVLLPYTEITLKPTRFLSLCRGAFDLVLPFSESSAAQMRRLRPGVATQVVGFPVGFSASKTGEGRALGKGDGAATKRFDVLYFAGTNFEAGAAELLREAFDGLTDLRLRVRLHPRGTGTEAREVFDWLGPDDLSDPRHVALSDDITNAGAALAVRSTAAIEAMIAGVPFVWLSPAAAQEQLKFSTLRKQDLTPLEATTASELRAIVQRLCDDESERQRIVKEQWSRLRAAGYDRNYFELVASALRQAAGAARAEAQ
jgi:hypothetical protein